MNLHRRSAVERGMRTLLLAALFASGLSFAAPPSIVDPELAITAANGKDGGKKKKDDKEKEEDYALKLKVARSVIS